MLEVKFFTDNYLPIKTIAEYCYCSKAGLYMFLNWENNENNIFLYEGSLYHKNLNKINIKYRENKKQLKNMLVFNHKYKIFGFCDLVEVNKDLIIPIEYKAGYPRINFFHKIQLTLQALCLEEMLKKEIDFGYIYFYKINKRKKVIINEFLKNYAIQKINEFRKLIENIDFNNKINGCSKKGCSYFYLDSIPSMVYH